ncbi:DNRLRE domain-containing protein [Clostridium thailandense]|uniref:DNRLRE domain-containing protein n=1 Tax=Clostridium thailandense TaxID=2794346 RepID=UPI003988BFC7
MASVIIPATKSLTITTKYPNKSLNGDTIAVGCDGTYKYYSYLFFDISSIPCDALILSAELVLFKTDDFYCDCDKIFSISPLCDYFSSYTSYKNQPDVIFYIKKNFYPLTSKVAVTVNINPIISLWVENKLINKGIALYYEKNKKVVANFGSSKSKDEYTIPFINVNYEKKKVKCEEDPNKNNATIRKVRVIGTVGAHSTYDSVVNLQVTRQNGNKDNYYVADEYVNPSDSPKHIDETYNIGVIPKESNGDQEEMTLYGAYRD